MMISPRKIGAYAVIRRLGEGSSGRVFEVEKDGRRFALKLFQGEGSRHPEFRELFIKEFLLLSRYRHPHVVAVSDFGWDPETLCPYYIAEFVQGGDLRQVLSGRDSAVAVTLLFQAIRALGFLHRHGLCHRDLKPENILVADDGIKLIDFGLMSVGHDVAAGTPRYMAPEVLAGKTYSAAADMYALGLSFFESWTGAKTFHAATFMELAVAKSKSVSFASPCWKNIPRSFQSVLASLTHPDPKQRPTALAALAVMLTLQKDKAGGLAALKNDALAYLKFPEYLDKAKNLPRVMQALDQKKPLVVVIRGEQGSGQSRLMTEIEKLALIRNFKVTDALCEPWELKDKDVACLVDEGSKTADGVFVLKFKRWMRQYAHLMPLLAGRPVVCFAEESVADWSREREEWEKAGGEWLALDLTDWDADGIRDLCAAIFSYAPSLADARILTRATGGRPQAVLNLLAALIAKDAGFLFDAALFAAEARKGFAGSARQNFTPNFAFAVEGRLNGARECLELDQASEALSRLQSVASSELSAGEFKEWHWLKAEALLKLGDAAASLRHFEIVLERCEPAERGPVFERMGLSQLRAGQYGHASRLFEKASEFFSAEADRLRCRNYLAQVSWRTGKIAEAKELFLANWRVYENALTDDERAGITNFNLTGLHLDAKEYRECLSQAEREAVYYGRYGRAEAKSRVLYDSGVAWTGLKDAVRAKQAWQEGSAIAEEIRNPELLLRFHNALGSVFTAENNFDAAYRHYETALYHAATQSDPTVSAQILYNMALIRTKQGLDEQARACLASAGEFVQEVPEGEARKSLAEALARVSRHASSRQERGETRGPDKLKTVKEKKSQTERIAEPASSDRFISYAKGDAMPADEDQLKQVYRSLLHISELLGSVRPVERLLELALKYAIQLSGAERGVMLLNDDGELSIVCTHNVSESDALKEISLGIAKNVLSTGLTVHTRDASRDELFAANQSVILHNLRSVLCVPIRCLGKTEGVVYLDQRGEAEVFTDFDKEVLTLYCRQAGLAIEQAKLLDFYEAKQNELARELEVARDEKDRVLKELKAEKRFLRHSGFAAITTESPKMLGIFETLTPLMDSNIAVHVTGESGTGKELLARAIHSGSPRQAGPFVATNCGAIAETLIESELFGHKAGAFTGASRDKKGLFESADGGTLFLDEVGELSPAAQVKLLRVLQESEVVPVGDTRPRKVSVRLVTATHRNLRELVAGGKFREDLFYRVNEFQVELPPLRDRLEDIPPLVEGFLAEYAREHGLKTPLRADAGLVRRFMTHSWPGNIRELRSTVRVGAALSRKGVLLAESYPPHYAFLSAAPVRTPQTASNRQEIKAAPALADTLSLEDYEAGLYAKAYAHHDFHAKKTYEALGVSGVTFFAKIKKWDLKDESNPLYSCGVTYLPGKTLKEQIESYVAETYRSTGSQAAATIAALGVSPGYFYKWKKGQKGA